MSQETRDRPLAFLDTNVIVAYLEGKEPSARLFDDQVLHKVRLATNPIVLQEILTLAHVREDPEQLRQIRQRLEILPVNFERAESLLPHVTALRNRLAHSNDILIMSSAVTCDFLVTYDLAFRGAEVSGRPQILTPEEFFALIGAPGALVH